MVQVAGHARLSLGGEGSGMTETVVGMDSPAEEVVSQPSAEELHAARELVRQARDRVSR